MKFHSSANMRSPRIILMNEPAQKVSAVFCKLLVLFGSSKNISSVCKELKHKSM